MYSPVHRCTGTPRCLAHECTQCAVTLLQSEATCFLESLESLTLHPPTSTPSPGQHTRYCSMRPPTTSASGPGGAKASRPMPAYSPKRLWGTAVIHMSLSSAVHCSAWTTGRTVSNVQRGALVTGLGTALDSDPTGPHGHDPLWQWCDRCWGAVALWDDSEEGRRALGHGGQDLHYCRR